MAYFVSSKNPFELKGADKTPYLFRPIPYHGNLETDKLVGGTVAWNQNINHINLNDSYGYTFSTGDNGYLKINGTSTSANNKLFYEDNIANKDHKFLVMSENELPNGFSLSQSYNANIRKAGIIKGTQSGGTRLLFYFSFNAGATADNFETHLNVMNLTQMFGSTIADYIYSLEQATAGAGVAWFKKLFPNDYYAYNAGELMSVKTSAHVMTGFNQWDEEWEVGSINSSNGEKVTQNDRIRSKNFIPIIPNTIYHYELEQNIQIYFYDGNKNYLSYFPYNVRDREFTTPNNCYYIMFNANASYGTTYNHDICINLHWDGERDGEYEAYKKYSYALDSDLELCGLFKLDASNNLYCDGDTYESDGTVTRRYGKITFDGSSDENWVVYGGYSFQVSNIPNFISPSSSVIASITTDRGYKVVAKSLMPAGDPNNIKYISAIDSGANGMLINIGIDNVNDLLTYLSSNPLTVLYELATSTTESADTFQNPQIVDDWGTEEYVDSRVVKIPVGHESKYYKVDFPS